MNRRHRLSYIEVSHTYGSFLSERKRCRLQTIALFQAVVFSEAMFERNLLRNS